jgi:hypothetical protein
MNKYGAYYWRREGISGVQLRLPGVVQITEEFLAMVKQFSPLINIASARILEMTPADRQARARQLVAEIDKERILRLDEKPHSFETPENDWSPDMNDPLKLISFGITDFWSVITAENSALAFELGALAEYEGSHPLFVVDANNMTGLPAEILASTFYAEVALKRPLVGSESLVSFEKAHQVIGFQPGPSLNDWLKDS